jgi:serine/threonine protein kinase
MFCTSCGAPISPTSRFCSSCGEPVDVNTAATILGNDLGPEPLTISPSAPSARRTPPPPPPSPRTPRTPSNPSALLTSSEPIGGGRFTPGLIIAERYRIVALLGRGGMSEVYRAEDLRLSQVVAIKFLPQSFSQDAASLARFHSEVRIARQVSHANVCRVFDIGEVEGIPFLTMEYVDGEDLASLVRRIGRLSPDKATEIARQICAGLAAAHDRGVVHRDLKPANVMLDGGGRVRITDFGLAAIASNIKDGDVRAGTPAYMAPEQFAGKEVTAKSDLYSLGLILYEILTGKRAFEAATMPELRKLREEGKLTSPSSLVRDLDPLLERVILRCLEKEPSQRPSSALQIAAALPGGDPLAAALAAGETPSPEMVAAAGETEGLKPQIGALCLLGICLALGLLFVVGKRTKLISFVPLGDSPEVLSTKAREMIAQFGYRDAPVDTAFAFRLQNNYLQYIQENQKTNNRWEALRADEPPSLAFWYRQSPKLLTSFAPSDNLIFGRIQPNQPPMDTSGSKLVLLSPNGRLLRFEAVPPQVDEAAASSPAADWAPLFAAAAMDPKQFKPVEPRWFPLAWGDTRAAWEGSWPTRSEIPLRIEAAAYRGKPIYFDLISPWDRPERMENASGFRQNAIGQWFSLGLLGFILGMGVWIAVRNLKLGRGDIRGSVRLAIFVLIVSLVTWVLVAHHVSSPFEFILFILALSVGLFFSVITWLLYVSLEPYVRRHWPGTIISWTRMLSGQFRDPVLGRDLLLGSLFGVTSAVLEHLQPLVEAALGRPPMRPFVIAAPFTIEGVRGALATVFYHLTQSLSNSLLIFFLFFVVRLVLRKNWLAAVVTSLLFCIPSLGAQNPLIDALFTAPFFLAYLFILYRFGLVALAALYFTDQLADSMPITTPLNAWYAEGGLVAVAAILALAFYSFEISRADKPLFGSSVLDA